MPTSFDVTVTTAAGAMDAALPDAPVRASSVLVSAPSTNTDNILWGDATLRNQTIAPGDTPIVIPIQAFLAEVILEAASGSQTLHCAYTLQQ